jgi:ATP-dependent DNA ligase
MPRKDIMLAHPVNWDKIAKWPYAIIQPKINGFRCRVVCGTDGFVRLYSSQSNEFFCLPHINSTFQTLVRNGELEPPFEFDGELYNHELPLQYISSIVKRQNNVHIDFEKIKIYIFDVINPKHQEERLRDLNSLEPIFRSSPTVEVVDSYMVNSSQEDVRPHIDNFLDQGYEGAVFRNPFSLYERKRSYNLFKYKPRETDVYQIVGFEEEMSMDGEPKGSLGSFICIKDGQDFNVGTGPVLTKEGRAEYWKDRQKFLTGKYYAVVTYPELTADRQVPFQPVVKAVFGG